MIILPIQQDLASKLFLTISDYIPLLYQYQDMDIGYDDHIYNMSYDFSLGELVFMHEPFDCWESDGGFGDYGSTPSGKYWYNDFIRNNHSDDATVYKYIEALLVDENIYKLIEIIFNNQLSFTPQG